MISWGLEALAASTLLMLVVLALRGPVARRFGAQAAYLLWLLPALRMILPRIPEAAVPVQAMPVHVDVARLIAAAVLRAHQTPAAAAASQSAPVSVDWLSIGLVLWLGGAVSYLAWQLGRHHRFMSIALAHADHGFLRGGIKVRLSPVVSGPLAAGIFHRHILLPDDFERRYTGAEQQLALAHELAHHRRGDLIANGAALVMLALHWFNPIAHWAYRAFRADQELACDATVLGASPESRSDYGRALIKSAAAGMPGSGTCALGPATELKRRITMIAHSTSSRARRLAGAALATILVGAGLGLTASGGIAAPSRIAPASVKPLFHAQPQAKLIMVADSGQSTATTVTRTSDDTDGEDPVAPTPPVEPVLPVPPVAAVPPVPPVSPMAPVPPVPPAAVNNMMSEVQINAAKQAGEAARQALANVDFAKINREAMMQARTELERDCKHAKPAVPGENDAQAIQRLAMGCVDMAAIGREVEASLKQAMDEVRSDQHISEADRSKALAEIARARAEMSKKFAQ